MCLGCLESMHIISALATKEQRFMCLTDTAASEESDGKHEISISCHINSKNNSTFYLLNGACHATEAQNKKQNKNG